MIFTPWEPLRPVAAVGEATCTCSTGGRSNLQVEADTDIVAGDNPLDTQEAEAEVAEPHWEAEEVAVKYVNTEERHSKDAAGSYTSGEDKDASAEEEEEPARGPSVA